MVKNLPCNAGDPGPTLAEELTAYVPRGSPGPGAEELR